jgi:Trypsin-like peptidase domain
MPLSFDPCRREWLELGPNNPVLVDELRPALVSFVAYDTSKNARLLGTGAVVGAMQGVALILTARHVALDGAVAAQKPHLAGSGGPFRDDRPAKHLSVAPARLKLFWGSNNGALGLNVFSTHFNDFADLQGCVAVPQNGDEESFQPAALAVDLRPVQIGEVVYHVSYADMALNELVRPTGADGAGQVLEIRQRVSVRIGTVTGLHPNGLRMYRWPSFTTSAPSEPGMSGGVIVRMRECEPLGVCGVISGDCSTETARTNFFTAGETVAAAVWPVLALKMPIAVSSNPRDIQYRTWFDAMKSEVMPAPLGGLDGYSVTEAANGVISVKVPADR